MSNRLTQELIKELGLDARSNRVAEFKNMGHIAVIQEVSAILLEDLIWFGDHKSLKPPQLKATDYLALVDKDKPLDEYILRISKLDGSDIKKGKSYVLDIIKLGIPDYGMMDRLVGYSVRALFESIGGLHSINMDISLPFGKVEYEVNSLTDAIISYLKNFRKASFPVSEGIGSYFRKEGIMVDSITTSQFMKESKSSKVTDNFITLKDARKMSVYAELASLEDYPLRIGRSTVIAEIGSDFSEKANDVLRKKFVPDIVVDRKSDIHIFGDKDETIYNMRRWPLLTDSKLYCSMTQN